VDGAHVHWGTPEQNGWLVVTPYDLAGYQFPAVHGPEGRGGSPFCRETGRAPHGSLEDIAGIVAGTAGTNVVARAAPGPGPGPEKG
jgi:hypothetical protein